LLCGEGLIRRKGHSKGIGSLCKNSEIIDVRVEKVRMWFFAKGVQRRQSGKSQKRHLDRNGGGIAEGIRGGGKERQKKKKQREEREIETSPIKET